MTDADQKYVSRAGAKLEHALEAFGIDVAGKVCADLGANKGGFTDCMLSRGALKVYAVETGYGVLEWKLRSDPRVVVMERTNALHVSLPETPTFISIDVSWTPQRLIVPHALELLAEGGDIVSLLKPHYEAPKEIRGGALAPEKAEEVAHGVKAGLESAGVNVAGMTLSPVAGEKAGNREYLLWIRH